jgi:GT2 family glycosyltransferase
VGLVGEFDGVTVANPALQQRYGGEIIRHARDEKHFNPSPELKRKSRKKFGIPQDKKVVLFLGTSREHKGLLETAQAIASLKRKEIAFAIVGDFPDPSLKERLQAIVGVDYAFIGNQPINTVPEVAAIGDLCVLLQDPASAAAQFQVPAKLGDALAMRIPVLATETPALADAFIAGALMPVNTDNIAQQLAKLLSDPNTVSRLQDAGHIYFSSELSIAENRRHLQRSITLHSNRPLSSATEQLARHLGGDLISVVAHIPKAKITQAAGTTANLPPLPTQKIAVVVHVYYPELWPEIADRLKAIEYPFDLYITTTPDKAPHVTPAIMADFPQARIHVQPNRGMDVQPFLSLVPVLVEEGYLAVCKLHTKKGEGEQGARWRHALLDTLVGDNATCIQLVHAFARQPKLKLVGPASLYQSARKLMLDNAPALSDLFQLIEGRPLPSADWGFFSGTMFWVRPASLRKLANDLTHIEERHEAACQKDGQLVHALERLFGLLPALQCGEVGLLHPALSSPRFALQLIPPATQVGQAWMGDLLHQYSHLAEDLKTLDESNLFDAAHYLAQTPELASHGIHLSAHYLLIGRFQGKTPHPDFDPVFYAKQHAAKLTGGLDPFLHYLREGAKAGLLLCATQEQEAKEIPNFRYRALNTALIDWVEQATKPRDFNRVSIIIPVLDKPELTKACIESLYQHTPQNRFELIIVDNGSNSTTQQLLSTLASQHTDLRLIRNEKNLNFALGSNLGFAASTGEQVIFLNNDTTVTPNWLEPLVEPLGRPEISAVQPKLLYPDGTIQSIGVVFSDRSPLGYPIYAGRKPEKSWAGRNRAFLAVSGACMAVRAKDFARIQGFDPVYLNGQEDVDLCLRLNQEHHGTCVYAAASTVIHRESCTRGRHNHTISNRRYFANRWRRQIKGDDKAHYAADGFLVKSWQVDAHENERVGVAIYRPVLEKHASLRTNARGEGSPAHHNVFDGRQTRLTRYMGRSDQRLETGWQPYSLSLPRKEKKNIWLSHLDFPYLQDECVVEFGGLILGRMQRGDAIDRGLPVRVSTSMEVFARLTNMRAVHSLSLRQGDTVHSVSSVAPELPDSCVLHAFSEVPIMMESIWYSNDRDLRISFNAQSLADVQSVVVRGYQYDPVVGGGLTLLGEHELTHGFVQLADFALINPYLPVLLTLARPDAFLVDATLLPYPSLLPGGVHEVEGFISKSRLAGDLSALARSLVTEHLRARDATQGWALGQLQIDIHEAIGAERIFSSDVKEWLWSVFSLRIKVWRMPESDATNIAYWDEVFAAPWYLQSEESFKRNAVREQQGITIVCPPDAVPTLHVLTASQTKCGLKRLCGGEYIITREHTNSRWRVILPTWTQNTERAFVLDGAIRYPIVLSGKAAYSSETAKSSTPIAIIKRDMHMRHSTQLIMPVAPEIDSSLSARNLVEGLWRIGVVITVEAINHESFQALLESLKLQCNVEICAVVMASPQSVDYSMFASLLQGYFPQRNHLVECTPGESYADRFQRASVLCKKCASNAYLLFINQPVILHDRRTLETLARLLSEAKVATASCMLIGSSEPKSPSAVGVRFSGVLPVRELTSEESEWTDFDAHELFPQATYPVASNGDALFMMKADLWRKSGGYLSIQSKDRHAALEYSALLSERGLIHLLTTRVSSELVEPLPTSASIHWVPPSQGTTSIDASARIEVLPA